MSVNDYSVQSKIPSGRNAGLLGLNLLALAASSAFWLPYAIDGYDSVKQKFAHPEPYVSVERASSANKVIHISDLQPEPAFIPKSEMRVYVKDNSGLLLNGLCWYDIVDGHGRKVGGERAACDRASK